jgi:hypothetical protein
MKKTSIAVALALVLVLTLVGSAFAASPKPGTDFNGPHFNLNLVAKDKLMPGDYDNPDRHTMFVPLDTTDMTFPIETPNNLGVDTMTGIKINMTQGAEFAVLDGNATDGEGSFQLGAGKYFVYIAVKAKSPKFENAYTDITGWVEAYDNLGQLWYYVPVGSVSVSKNGRWTDATGLFFVTDAEDPFGFNEVSGLPQVGDYGVWVFDYLAGLDSWVTDLYNFSDVGYFWQVDNNGNKLIQVRFYPMQ